MRRIIIILILATTLVYGQEPINPNSGGIMSNVESKRIESVLDNYFKALNNSSVPQALAQYGADGVFMPKEAPTATGQEQLKAAYEQVFKTLAFINMGFTIDELIIENNMAIVRTSSLGDVKIVANGAIIEGARHRELFVMQKLNDEWKIARYMFNTTAPLKH